ncbi:OmpP1/FadL family transporter [Enterobacter roggenkampii]
MNNKAVIKILLTFLTAIYSYQTIASGIYLSELGTADQGLAGAGNAARAGDASTIYTNPAGMSYLRGGQISAAIQALYGDFDYDVNKGNSPGNVVGWQPGGSLFYSQSVNERMNLGLGLYSNAGLSLDFGNEWKGGSLLDKASIMFITLQPTLSLKLNDKLSVGGGVTITQGRIKMSSGRTETGAQLLNESDIDYAYGGRLGVMYSLSKDTRLGLTWGSQQSFNFNINRQITDPFTGNSLLIQQAHMVLPQQIVGSIWHELNDTVALAFSAGWQQWSRFADNYVSSSSNTINSELSLQDTWNGSLGVQVKLTNDLRINAGFAYDSSWNKHDDNGSITWPSSSTWRFGTGAEYSLSDISEIGVAVEYAQGSTLKDSSPIVSGEYSSPSMLFLAAQYIYRF